MKKLLLSFVVMMLAFVANAQTVVNFDFSDATVFGYANPAANGEYTQLESGQKITKDGITITGTYADGNGIRFYRANPQAGGVGAINLRIYKGVKLTISTSGSEKITSLSIKGSNLGSSYLTGDGFDNGSWTGSASSITLNCIMSTPQFNSLKIELNGEEVHIANTPDAPYTVSQANDLIKAGKALNEDVYVKGTVSEVQEVSIENGNATYLISDGTQSLLVYRGYSLQGAKFTSPTEVEDGDDVIVYGKLVDYKGTYEFTAGSMIYSLNGQTEKDQPSVQVEHITIKDFLSKADTEKAYEITGQVMNISNSKYGNLTLKEGESDIYVYGVLDKSGAAQKFESLGVKAGDYLTVVGKYTEHDGTPEIKDAQYVKHEAGELPAYEPQGAGTQDDPYTIMDVKNLYGTSACPTDPVWVYGVIIGTAKSGIALHAGDEADANVASNIAIADGDGNWIPVELPGKSDVRTALNLLDNPENLGMEVAVCGTITAYFSVAGVKGVTAYEMDEAPAPADATGLTGTYTLYNQKLVADPMMGGQLMPYYEQSTITVTGTATGEVTITGFGEEAIKGDYYFEDGYGVVLFDADPYIQDEDLNIACAEYSDGIMSFINGFAEMSQNATAIKEGANITEIGGVPAEGYTMEFNYMNGLGEEGTYTCPLYKVAMEDEEGYSWLYNFLGISVFFTMDEEGGFVIAPSMQEDGTPFLFDMASDDFGLHFVKDGDNYKYECAAPGYCALNQLYYIVSINLKKTGDATGIATVDKAAQNMIFNLAGQRINKMQKGVNIVGGKKVLK